MYVFKMRKYPYLWFGLGGYIDLEHYTTSLCVAIFFWPVSAVCIMLAISQPVLIICQLDFLGSSCQKLALYLETRPALLAAHRSNAGGFGICKKMDISCFVFLLCFPPLSIYIERKERRKEESKTCNYVVQSVQDGSGTF